MRTLHLLSLIKHLKFASAHGRLSKLQSLVRSPGSFKLQPDAKQGILKEISTILEEDGHRVVMATHHFCPWLKSCETDTFSTPDDRLLNVVICPNPKAVFTPLQDEEPIALVKHEDWLKVYDVAFYLGELSRRRLPSLEMWLGLDCEQIVMDEDLRNLRDSFDLLHFREGALLSKYFGMMLGILASYSDKPIDCDSLPIWCDAFRRLSYGLAMANEYDPEKWSELLADPTKADPKSPEHILLTALENVRFGTAPDVDQVKSMLLRMRGILHKMLFKGERNEVSFESHKVLVNLRFKGIELNEDQLGAPPSEDKLNTVSSFLLSHEYESQRASQILALSVAGSQLHDLHLKQSDDDFYGVYALPTKSLGRRDMLEGKDYTDVQRRSNDNFDCSLFETQKFAFTLWKGSIDAFQMLYTDSEHLIYEHELFRLLKAERHLLVSEKLLKSYIKYVFNHFWMIDTGKNTPNKLLYRVFHKLGELERLSERKDLAVVCEGEEKDWIMRIRRGPLEGDFAYEKLRRQAEVKVQDLRLTLAGRNWRYPDRSPLPILRRWVLRCHGLPVHYAD